MRSENKVYFRNVEHFLINALKDKISVLLLGPRQTGKTTLASKIVKKFGKQVKVLEYSFVKPDVREKFEKYPQRLIQEIQLYQEPPLVFIDEIQKVPSLVDAVQYLIDTNKAYFILTGSSARKLRRHIDNLLAGRVIPVYLSALTFNELNVHIEPHIFKNVNNLYSENTPARTDYENIVNNQLVFGSLPRIITADDKYKQMFLRAYSHMYLEEEIRQEALVRRIGSFGRFLQLAALESGSVVNFTNLAMQSGVSVVSIREFYQILEDTLLVYRLDPYLKSPRKRLLKRPKFYFFDIGVRNSLARVPLDPNLINVQKGILFEHFVMLEIFRRSLLPNANFTPYYWRTRDGTEVDCVIEFEDGTIVPIEIKAGTHVLKSKINGLINFIKDHPARQGYVVSQTDTPYQLTDNITVIPWWML